MAKNKNLYGPIVKKLTGVQDFYFEAVIKNYPWLLENPLGKSEASEKNAKRILKTWKPIVKGLKKNRNI